MFIVLAKCLLLKSVIKKILSYKSLQNSLQCHRFPLLNKLFKKKFYPWIPEVYQTKLEKRILLSLLHATIKLQMQISLYNANFALNSICIGAVCHDILKLCTLIKLERLIVNYVLKGN